MPRSDRSCGAVTVVSLDKTTAETRTGRDGRLRWKCAAILGVGSDGPPDGLWGRVEATVPQGVAPLGKRGPVAHSRGPRCAVACARCCSGISRDSVDCVRTAQNVFRLAPRCGEPFREDP